MGAVSRFGREGLSRFNRDMVRKWGSVPEAQPRLEPIKNPAPIRFQSKMFHGRLGRSLTGTEWDFSVYFGARIPANAQLGCRSNGFPDSFKVHRIGTGAKYDQAKNVYVYSAAALLPQDFEIVQAESQRQPEA